MLQKGSETEKKVWLRVGLNPQLRWLTSVVYVVLAGMYNSCSLSSLYTSAFNAL